MKKLTKTNLSGAVVLLLSLALLVMAPTSATADPSIVWVGDYFPTAISADGSVVVGNSADGFYETFRWTADVGVVRLGMSSALILGSTAGTPDVSDDGNHVSATVADADSTYVTQGIWTKGEGWATSMPPIPSDGSPSSGALGSAWGLSGDGSTVTGLYWRENTDGNGSAHANTWSQSEGFAALPSPVRNCRANDLNYDGSIAVGWSERADGVWCPTVWEDGGYTVLHDENWSTEAFGISNDGNTIWGKAYNPLSNQIEAALWLRTESGWQESTLGVLPGTFAGYGLAQCNDMTEDGSMIVGYNAFDWGSGVGFVWTMEQGMVSAADYFEAEGFVLPDTYVIANLTGISNNGLVLTGFGFDRSIFPYQYTGFIATREGVTPVPDDAMVALGMRLEGNFPNPFNPSTTIALSLDRDQNVQLEVFNVAGRLVRKLQSGILSAGRHEVTWNGRDEQGQQVASGIYFARVKGNHGSTQSQPMMLVK